MSGPPPAPGAVNSGCEWIGSQTIAPDVPWVAVTIPEGDLSERKEALGSTRGQHD